MEYNNYYSVQSGHPPSVQQHGGSPQLQQTQPIQPGGQMMQPQMPQQQQNIRQPIQTGPTSHHQQMQQMQSHQQQQAHIGHHSQQINLQSQHPNYHHMQPHQTGPPASHSSSPHGHHHHHHQQQHQHLNHSTSHQSNMPGPLHQQSPVNHNLHSQSPHQVGPMQSLNQIARPQMGQNVMNQSQQILHQPVHHQQNFFVGNHLQHTNIHHYPHHHQHHPQPPIMHHPGPTPVQHPHVSHGISRNSPFYLNILQTEFRVIELNRRLQCRPTPRQPHNPLPSPYDESIWWERFASDFFEDDATLTLQMHDDKAVEYTIGRTLIPRFFRSYFDGGVLDLSINLRNPKETCNHPLTITLDCDQAFIITNNIVRHPSMPTNQSVMVHTEGHLTLEFVSNHFDNLSIRSWKFYTRGSREYIDRSLLTNMGLPNNYFAEPLTRNGFTKSTITYLKMCMIMEPMQELMLQHKQLKLDPRTCLQKLLFERFKFRSGEDVRATTSKRRKRKSSAAPAVSGNTTSKKSKVGLSSINNNNICMNNMIMSPSNPGAGLPLASQDIMIVGEPSVMGGDFGDDNERKITRLENTQYDPTASVPTCLDQSDDAPHIDNEMNLINEETEASIESLTMSPSMIHQHQAQHPSTREHLQIVEQTHHKSNAQLPNQSSGMQHKSPQSSSREPSSHNQPGFLLAQINDLNPSKSHHDVNQIPPVQDSDNSIADSEQINNESANLFDTELPGDEKPKHEPLIDESNHVSQNGSIAHDQQSSEHHMKQESNQSPNDNIKPDDAIKHQDKTEGNQVKPISNASIETSCTSDTTIKSEVSDNHNDSIQNVVEDLNQSSQLPCSTSTAKSAIEQQQPVDNGVA